MYHPLPDFPLHILANLMTKNILNCFFKTHFVHIQKIESFPFIIKNLHKYFLIKYLDNKEHNQKTY